MKIKSFGMSDRGRVRPHNEDALLVAPERGLFAVADGMGGHAAGEVASKIAIETVEDTLGGEPNATRNVPELLRAAVTEANRRIAARIAEQPEYQGMGTTLVICVVHGGTLHVAHVGDSRAYLVRKGVLTQLTTDHSFVNELVRLGMLSKEEAARDPRRNVVTRALGSGSGVAPDVVEERLGESDLILLCTDGLNSMIDDSSIAKQLERGSDDPQGACSRLIDEANRAGGEDNVTVIVATPELNGVPDAVASDAPLEDTTEA